MSLNSDISRSTSFTEEQVAGYVMDATKEVFSTMVMMDVVGDFPLKEPVSRFKCSITGMVGFAGTYSSGTDSCVRCACGRYSSRGTAGRSSCRESDCRTNFSCSGNYFTCCTRPFLLRLSEEPQSSVLSLAYAAQERQKGTVIGSRRRKRSCDQTRRSVVTRSIRRYGRPLSARTCLGRPDRQRKRW